MVVSLTFTLVVEKLERQKQARTRIRRITQDHLAVLHRQVIDVGIGEVLLEYLHPCVTMPTAANEHVLESLTFVRYAETSDLRLYLSNHFVGPRTECVDLRFELVG